jgi:sugar O-acyltransferase (sialic acid O-acetyltransferase NeuD family)
MNQVPVIVVGAGGHGLVVADSLLAQGRDVLGYVDADAAMHGQALLGLPVLGDDAVLEQHRKGAIELANGIGGVGDLASVENGSVRRRVQARSARRWRSRGWRFASVIHPQAIVSVHAVVEPGAQVLAGAVVQALARIERGAIVNTRAVVEHHAQVGAFSHVAPGAVLCGHVVVGAESHVGANAVVRQGITLAERVVAGIGAAVVRNVAHGAVIGVPARGMKGHK